MNKIHVLSNGDPISRLNTVTEGIIWEESRSQHMSTQSSCMGYAVSPNPTTPLGICGEDSLREATGRERVRCTGGLVGLGECSSVGSGSAADAGKRVSPGVWYP